MTDNFKNWFGDSKVVDEDGNPLVVYHGTDNDFNVFDKNRIGEKHWQSKSDAYGGGFFFTDKESRASRGRYKKKVYLKLENPLLIHLEDKYGYEIDYFHATDKYDLNHEYYLQTALENKNDGIIIKTPRGSLYIAFEPTQIKLADGSNTTFDGENPDIRMQIGGQINNWFNGELSFLNW